MHWKIPKIWDNATVFILGGGPSISLVDLSLLKTKRIIAVNSAFRLVPWADVCFFGDARWLDWNIEPLSQFHGLKITCADRQKFPSGILKVRRGRSMYGIDSDRERLTWNRNSGACAINLAVHLGAVRVVLLGFDMQMVNGKHHFHDWHKAPTPNDIYENRFLQCFPHIKTALDKLGVACVHGTPNSAIKCFDYIPLEELCKN